MAATDSLSSCAPHANCQSPPPMAHAPTPIGVISRSLAPSRFLVMTYILPVFETGTLDSSAGDSGGGPAGGGVAGAGIAVDDSRDRFRKYLEIDGFADEFP